MDEWKRNPFADMDEFTLESAGDKVYRMLGEDGPILRAALTVSKHLGNEAAMHWMMLYAAALVREEAENNTDEEHPDNA